MGIPVSYDIVDHLPVLIGSKKDYGKWSCFYCAKGEKIHLKYGCNGATIKTHAFLVADKEVCHVCGKNISIVIPSWYIKYKELIEICEKYNINY